MCGKRCGTNFFVTIEAKYSQLRNYTDIEGDFSENLSRIPCRKKSDYFLKKKTTCFTILNNHLESEYCEHSSKLGGKFTSLELFYNIP